MAKLTRLHDGLHQDRTAHGGGLERILERVAVPDIPAAWTPAVDAMQERVRNLIAFAATPASAVAPHTEAES